MDFRILGPLEVWHDGEQISVRGTKQRALLAILLVHANEVVSSDLLVEELWGDEPPHGGGAALRVRISQLRKALGAAGHVLKTQAPGYVLELGAELDLHRFERIVAASAREDPAQAAALLREGLALWRGPPLHEFAYEDFAQAAIARLEELRLIVLERRIDADVELGQHAELVGEIEALVAEHPLRERLRSQLMLALYRSGRQADALAVYAATRKLLVDELGIEPGPALHELEAAILRQDPGLELEPPHALARSILIAPLDPQRFGDLLSLAEPLARGPAREIILAQLIDSTSEIGRASALSRTLRESLRARGIATRAAAFTTAQPGFDIVRIASEQDVDLLLFEAPAALLDDELVRVVLAGTPCDVGILVVREAPPEPGAVLVPFIGAEHDWSAIELGAWIARSHSVPLWLAGPVESGRDASRLLASASLAVQRAHDVQAEPLLLQPGADALVEAAADAALVVLGLSDRWRKEGLGQTRHALATRARPPTLVVRRGLRPGGLAPPESVTRFTWSIAAH